MIIRMFHTMSSGRHDGRVWPPAGVDFEVPDWEGEDLVNGGNAYKVSDSLVEEENPEAPLDDLKAAAVDYAESVPEPEPAPEPDNEVPVGVQPEVPGPPRPAASKQDWIEWALSQGADQIAAMNATKQQLMELYGQRP